MSDANPGGSQAGPSNNPTASPASKAIGNLAKKQGDVTRLGTQKLKFAPTLPARRKKEGEIKQEEYVPSKIASPDRGPGRGRGRGEGRGGIPRGGAPRGSAVEMTASGPFAMGPAMAGSSARRSAPRSNFTPIVPSGPTSSLGSGLSHSAPPSLKREKGKDAAAVRVNEEEEVYSEPDEGVEIVDMENIRQMDWMAPESLQKEKDDAKKSKKAKSRRGGPTEPIDKKGKAVVKSEEMDIDEDTGVTEVDLANAVDLSESEEEEELEDIIEDFALAAEPVEETDMRQERLYFFQFPDPFPTFVPKHTPRENDPIDVDSQVPSKDSDGSDENARKVSFAEGTKPPAVSSTSTSAADKKDITLDGMIGQLEVYQSGAVKMRLGKDIVMDVTAATQPSFLQHAVHLDMSTKRLCVLGEVNKRFVVSPNIDALLNGMDAADLAGGVKYEEELIKMDTDA